MHRFIDPTDPYTIHTQNGADRSTRLVLPGNLKTYELNEKGFGADLAWDCLAFIAAHPALWNQGMWRVLGSEEEMIADREIPEPKAFDQALIDIAAPLTSDGARCGTAGCLAGWAGEMVGVDWVVDVATLSHFRGRETRLPQWEDYDACVLVSKSDPRFEAVAEQYNWPGSDPEGCDEWCDTVGQWRDTVEQEAQEMLAAFLDYRGFTPATHKLLSISEVAAILLGFAPGSQTPLFGGSNSLASLYAYIRIYTEHGPDADLGSLAGGISETKAKWRRYRHEAEADPEVITRAIEARA